MRVGLDGSRSGHRDETTCILHELQAVFAVSAAWRVSAPDTSRPPPPSVTTGTPPSRSRTLTMPAQAVAVCTICCTRRRTDAVAPPAAKAGARSTVATPSSTSTPSSWLPGGHLGADAVGELERRRAAQQGAEGLLDLLARARHVALDGDQAVAAGQVDEHATALRRRGGAVGGLGGEDHGSYKSPTAASCIRRPVRPRLVVRPAPPWGSSCGPGYPSRRASPSRGSPLHRPRVPVGLFRRAVLPRARVAIRRPARVASRDDRPDRGLPPVRAARLLDRQPDDRIRAVPPPLRDAVRRPAAGAPDLERPRLPGRRGGARSRGRRSPTRSCAPSASRGSRATG